MGQHGYKIKAIPTIYKEILYRSRLEARWAVFFDLMEWEFTYEPEDLEKWSPDFTIRTTAGNDFLVEIKPLRMVDVKLRMRLGEATNFSKGILILSQSPFTDNRIPNAIGLSSLGGKILNAKNEEDFEFCTSAVFNAYGKGIDIINFCEYEAIDGNELTEASEYCKALWNQAGNEVQFLRPYCE